MKSEGHTSAQRINEYIDIAQSQKEFMDSFDDPYGENDKGMEMLAGVILTLILTGIIGSIYLIYKVSTWS
jgi:hypothetical protein